MKIQEIVSDVRARVGTAGKQYQDAFKAYVNAQRKAVGVVTKNGQTLANTEIGAAKNIFAAARASFDKARTDGVRKIANDPQAYVPNGRAQIVSAYKDTIDLLVKTGNELTTVVSSGYKTVLGKLSGETQKKAGKATTANKTTASKSNKASSSAKTSAAKTTTAKTTAAKRKTASTRKTAASTSKSAANGTTTRKRSTAKKAATGSDESSAS